MIRIPFFLVLTSILFVALSVSIDYLRENLDEAPIRIHAASLEGTSLKQGESLRIVLSVQRNRQCHTVVARYVHSVNGDVVVYREAIGGDAPIGLSRYAFTFPLPDSIALGKYTFKGVVASTCGTRRYIEVTPPLAFTVS